jgi:hypothetical protein
MGGGRLACWDLIRRYDELVVATLVLAPGIELSQSLEDFNLLLLQTDDLFWVAFHVAEVRREDVLALILVDVIRKIVRVCAENIG